MAGTGIDLSFLNEGNNLTLTIAQLQAMDAQLQIIASRSPALIELSRSFGLTYAQAAKLTTELGVAPKQLSEAVSTMRSLRGAGADAVTQFAVLSKQLGLTVEQMQLLSTQVDDLGDKKDVVNDLTTAFSALFLIDKVNTFKQAILETGKVMESLQTRLTTTLGTRAASDSALDKIQKFAAETPFEMVEVTDAFVKLKQRGIDPTNDALRALGDLSSSQGKGLNQTVEALLDASQGEFERLKEYGIKASGAGDKVNVSFQGMNKQIERTPEGITAGILSLGKMQGVAGGMELQSKTLAGSLSNLTDAQTKLASETFKLVAGPATALVQTGTKLIDTFTGLNPNIQLAILSVATLGGVLVTTVAALAAFKAANIGAALAQGATTLAAAPAAIATALNTAITRLATLAEIDLARSKRGTAAANLASTGATAADAAAKAAGTGATVAQTAAQTGANVAGKAGTAISLAGAVTAGLMAAAVLGIVATLAILVDTYQKSNQAEIEGAAVRESIAKGLKAVDEAYEKRIASEKALAKSVVDSAEVTRVAGLTASQRAAELQAKDNEIKENYNKNVQERIGWLQQFLDKIKEILNLPVAALSRTIELAVKLPLPGPIKDFITLIGQGVNKLEQFKTTADASKESDTKEFANTLSDAEGLKEKVSRTRTKAKDGSGADVLDSKSTLANASKGEVEGLSTAYDALIEKNSKMVAADATQQAQKDMLTKSLKAESEEVKQAIKLILEKEKRLQSVGTAEAQWAAEVKRVTENIGKQIASSEDANKMIEATKKQLENGFITQEQAATAFSLVAKYTQATGDVQQSAATELTTVRAKAYDKDKGLLETRLQMAELAGLGEITNAEQTGVVLAGIRKEQAALEVTQLTEKLELLKSLGKASSVDGIATEKSLNKARIDADKAAAEEIIAIRKEAIAKINKALSDAADARQAAESKQSTANKKAVLKDVKKGEISSDEADRRVSEDAAERQAKSLDAEIKLKLAKQKELGNIVGEEAKNAAKKLSLEILGLQDKAADMELSALKRLQKQKLDLIRKTADDAKALAELGSATEDVRSSADELNAYKANGADRKSVDEQTTASRLTATATKLNAELAAIAKERDATADLNLDKETAEKNRVSFATKTQQKLAEINRNGLDKFKQDLATRQRLIEDSAKDGSSNVTNANDSNNAEDERNLSEIRIAAARGEASAIAALNKGASDSKDRVAFRQAAQARELAAIELNTLEEKIANNLVANKDIESERLKLINKLAAAENSFTEATITYERKQREELTRVRIAQLDKVKQALVAEQEQISQIVSLASAQTSLEAARANGRDIAVNGRKQEIALAKEAADASGNKALSEILSRRSKELELNVVRAQADEIRRQYDTKLSMLELDIKSKEIASQQLVLEKEMSVLEAKGQLSSGRAEGKSAAELALLEQKVTLSERVLDLANKGSENTAKIAGIQRDTLALDKSNALQTNAQQIRAAAVRYELGGGKLSGGPSGIAASGLRVSTQAQYVPKESTDREQPKVPESVDKAIKEAKAVAKLPGPDYSSVTAASKLLANTFNDLANQTKKLQTKAKADEGPNAGVSMGGARATGGPAGTDGMYLVGEQGPELVSFAQQSYVYTASQTTDMLKAMNGLPTAGGSDSKSGQLLAELQKLNSAVAERQVGAVNVPVSVTTNDTNAIAQALAIVRADRTARHRSL